MASEPHPRQPCHSPTVRAAWAADAGPALRQAWLQRWKATPPESLALALASNENLFHILGLVRAVSPGTGAREATRGDPACPSPTFGYFPQVFLFYFLILWASAGKSHLQGRLPP